MRYYYPPRIGADLCNGFNTFDKLDDTADDHLDSLLLTIMNHEKKLGSRVEADFITWRGMMTKFMSTPTSTDGFSMKATIFQGTIFLEENHDFKLAQWAAQRTRPSGPPGGHSQDMMSYWGYKFETLSLLDRPYSETSRDEIEGREDARTSNKAQYCSVVKTGIGKSKMIIGGEVDALWDCRPASADDPINWVELKTTAEIHSDRQMENFEKKLQKFWAQSFLLGVPKIIVGFRDRDGILRGLEELETSRIPSQVKRRGKATWDGNTCINFTAGLLEWLKTVITGTEGVWSITRDSKDRAGVVQVNKIQEEGHGSIIFSEFLDWRRSLVQSTEPTVEPVPEVATALASTEDSGIEAISERPKELVSTSVADNGT
jgi:RAT1-interacting protein